MHFSENFFILEACKVIPPERRWSVFKGVFFCGFVTKQIIILSIKMWSNGVNRYIIAVIAVVAWFACYASAYPAMPTSSHHHHKRQSYARSNQLPAPTQDQYYGQASYNSYTYNNNGFNEPTASRRNYYSNGPPPPSSSQSLNNNGYYPSSQSNQYYDYPPSQRAHYQHYREPLQGSYASVNPIQREVHVRNGQLRQKEYQQRTGQEGRDTYDPFYFYVNPHAAAAAAAANQQGGPPPPPPPPVASSRPQSSSSPDGSLPPSPTTVTASFTSQAVSSREHGGGPPRNRRNSLNVPPSRDPYFDNEISGDKYEILTSKPSYPSRLQNNYPGPPSHSGSPRHPHHPPPPPHHNHYASSRYSSGGVQPNPYAQPPGNPNQFLHYEQIVGAEPVSFTPTYDYDYVNIIFSPYLNKIQSMTKTMFAKKV